MSSVEDRLDRLELEVDVLQRAVLLLTVSANPTAKWLEARFLAIEKIYQEKDE